MSSITTDNAVRPGHRYDLDGVTLYQSHQAGLYLFKTAPCLASGSSERPQVALTLLQNSVARLAGGTALFTLDSGAEAGLSRDREYLWRGALAARGVRTADLRFAPLPWRAGVARVLLPAAFGTAQPDKVDLNAPGATHTFLIALNALGADAWEHCVNQNAHLPAVLHCRFKYPCRFDGVSVTAQVQVPGEAVFRYLADRMPVSPDGLRQTVRAQAETWWQEMTTLRLIRILLSGAVGGAERTLTAMASEQALQQLWDRLWVCRPDLLAANDTVNPAEAGNVPFALAWRSLADARSYQLTASFKDGLAWLTGAQTTWLGPLFRRMTPPSIVRISTPSMGVTIPAHLTVEGDPAVRQVAVSWSASEGHTPQAPLFGPEGGKVTYPVTTHDPTAVQVRYVAKVLWHMNRWPVTTLEGEAPLLAGGSQIVLRPGTLVQRYRLTLRQPGGPVDTIAIQGDVIVHTRYTGPHLSSAVEESARLTEAQPLVITYPADPQGRSGLLVIRAWGVINGALLRASVQIVCSEGAGEIYLIADAGRLQIVPAPSRSNLSDGCLFTDDRLFTDEKEESAASAD